MTEEDEKLLNELKTYCERYFIPTQFIIEILNDQKVTPMTRGKATEYNAYLALKGVLDPTYWTVEKLNLAAQSNTHDEDVGIRHRKTGIRLIAESKSSVRGSFSDGKRARVAGVKNKSHFKVKCHKSRSHLEKAESSNDRYKMDEFDILLTNPLNGIYEGNTVSEYLELLHKKELVDLLHKHYGTKEMRPLEVAANNDFRFVCPSDIAENGYIPRTPYVLLNDDPKWKPIAEIEPVLLKMVEMKHKKKK